jgi:predicted aspartyl protease
MGAAELLKIQATIDGRPVRAMIDSGAEESFIHPEYVTRKTKPSTMQLRLPNGTTMKARSYIEKAELRIPGLKEIKMRINVANLNNHEAILGRDWLQIANPTIDWAKGKIIGQGPQKKSLKNSAIRYRYLNIIEAGTTSEEQWPEEYKEFAQLAQKDDNLPRHEPWDHRIPLQPGKQPTAGPIYAMSELELEALREYIDKNLKRGYIRESTSPAGYPVLFVKKKDGGLRLVVDYRKLNEITIKNRYTLPLISELQDRIQGVQWFTKLDIKGAYNRIRMAEGEEWKTAFRTRYGHYEYLPSLNQQHAKRVLRYNGNSISRRCVNLHERDLKGTSRRS